MSPQLLVRPRTAPVPPVLPGERAHHAQPRCLALPPQLRIARPPRIACQQPCLSLPLARHPHIRLLTGDHARRSLSYSARQPACLSPSSSANIGSPHTSQLFIALPPTGRYLKPSQVATPPTTTPPRRRCTARGGHPGVGAAAAGGRRRRQLYRRLGLLVLTRQTRPVGRSAPARRPARKSLGQPPFPSCRGRGAPRSPHRLGGPAGGTGKSPSCMQ